MEKINNKDGRRIMLSMVNAIQENKAYLSDIDGLIGDGDHGANMNKGFTLFAVRLGEDEISFSDGLTELGMVLFNEIGGSMGPIYGTIFTDMGESLNGLSEIGLSSFTEMMLAGLSGLQEIVDAREGDKTLIDTLSPAVQSLRDSLVSGTTFEQALADMVEAAKKGMDATKNMVAKYGRSSRLGERSRGVLDAGAVSSFIILKAMAEGITVLLSCG